MQADAIILEFGSARSDPYAAERIMRSLLQLPQRPMLILVNVREWCRCGATGRDIYEGFLVNRSCATPEECGTHCRSEPLMFNTFPGPEDDFASLCHHYGQLCVSLRDAIFDKVMAQAPGFTMSEVAGDCIHPSRGTRGHAYLTDIVIHALQHSHQAFKLLSSAMTPSMPPIPSPLLAPNRRCVAVTWRCYTYTSLPNSAYDGTSGRVRVGRFEAVHTRKTQGGCALLRGCLDLHGQARADCFQQNGGWRYCTRAFNARQARKPGLVAFAPGALLRLFLDTSGVASDSENNDSGILSSASNLVDLPSTTIDPCARRLCAQISLSYLTSYEQMGQAMITCEHGCACAPQHIDAHVVDPVRNVSVVKEWTFKATSAHACVLRVLITNATSAPDGGHKFKLIEAAVGFATDWNTSSSWPPCGKELQPHYRKWIKLRSKRKRRAEIKQLSGTSAPA